MSKTSFNKLYIGLLAGIIVPLIILFIYYLIKFNEVSFATFLRATHQYKIFFHVLSLCVIPDLGIFYLFINRKMFNGARGVIMACFIYALTVMIYKFL